MCRDELVNIALLHDTHLVCIQYLLTQSLMYMHAMKWAADATLVYKMHINSLVTVGLLASEGEN